MSEKLITVSDGEDFFKIPIDDLAEASADGFYVPAFQKSTIVSNGDEMFEIPVSDLAEAEAEGYRDTLIAERELLPEARRLLGLTRSKKPATTTAVQTAATAPNPPLTDTVIATAETIAAADTTIASPVTDESPPADDVNTEDLPEAEERS